MEIELSKEKGLNNNFVDRQNNFLNTTMGKVINTAINAGIRYLFPNMIENQIINIKDELLNNGLKEGINTAIEEAINIGKSAIGIVTGKFDNIEQIQTAIGKGGLIDSISNVLDKVINKGIKNGKIDNKVFNMIKNGKNLILQNVSTNIEDLLTSQIKTINKLDNYATNWKKYYSNKDFNKMDREYNKIEKEIEKIVPLENIIKEIRQIENVHNLIKSKGGKFDLTWEQIEASKVLI